MASDNKCCPYSFYVPAKDQALCDFLEAQSNLSMSIRLLIKAFMANYDIGGDDTTEYPDITTMDLRKLLDNTIVDPEKMHAKSQNCQASKVINKNEGSSTPTQSVQPEIQAEKVVTPVEEINEQVEEPIKEVVVESTDENNDVSVDETNVANEQVVEQKVETQVEKPENKGSESNVDDDMPEIMVEPEVPKKIVSSARDDYNAKQNAGNDASMDEIMAMLGGE